MLGPPGKDLERVWRYGHLQSVVLGGPDDVEPALFGHLHHLERVVAHRPHVRAVFHPLEVDRQLKFHRRASPQRITNGLAIGASDVFIHTVLGRV